MVLLESPGVPWGEYGQGRNIPRFVHTHDCSGPNIEKGPQGLGVVVGQIRDDGGSGLRWDRIDGEKRLHMRHVQKVRLTRHANAYNGFPAGEREVGLPRLVQETQYYCF